MLRTLSILVVVMLGACTAPTPLVLNTDAADLVYQKDWQECTQWAAAVTNGQQSLPALAAQHHQDQTDLRPIARLSPTYNPATYAVGAAIGQGITDAINMDYMTQMMTGFCLEERGYRLANRSAVYLDDPKVFCNLVLRYGDTADTHESCRAAVEERNRRLGYIN